ncbi:MAG TPA: arylamine N-acetyltransferase [Anaerolineales bacterium]
MAYPNLSDTLVKDILDYLECPKKAPTLRYLNHLIKAYLRKVPWESVSRIVKRHATLETEDCPRWPEEFWQETMQLGFGGTCYESSLAFYSLLMALGYEGYLTVNDMGASRGCHAAIVLLLNKHKYLVDITMPIHVAVRIDPQKIVRRNTAFQNYTIRPVQENKFEVERSHHPNRNAFTMIDIPVSLQDYQEIVKNDYRETGFFLRSVVMVRVMGDKTWRFFSDHKPYKLESFNRAGKREIFLEPETLPHILAELFQMPEDQISAALSWISTPSIMPRNEIISLPMVLEGSAQ